MTKHLDKEATVFIVFVLILIILISCEEYLPDSYQKETFTISDLDAVACSYLSCDTLVTDTTDIIIEDTDTTYVTESYTVHILLTGSVLYDIVDTNWIKERKSEIISVLSLETPADSLTAEGLLDSLMISGDSLVISMFFDSLVTAMDTLFTDTTLVIQNPGESDTCYAYYNHETSQGELYFYISWDLTEENMDEYIDIDFINRDEKLIDKESTVPIESISGCSYQVTVDKIIPKIRTRYSFVLDEASYLVRFIVSEPVEVEPFRAAILQD